MGFFLSTLGQMAFLILLIAAGYILAKIKTVPDNAAATLSRLENTLFIPCLVLGTFMTNFTTKKILDYSLYLLAGTVLVAIMIPVSLVLAKILAKDKYTKNIYIYSFVFSNFGFMGNAVVSAIFPEIFTEYLIFCIPFWAAIYAWGVPVLLMPSGEGKMTIGQTLKKFLNPMFIGMAIGIVIGLTSLPIPGFLNTAITTLGNCMSPVAMLLTGITIAKIDLKKTFTTPIIYVVSLVRLLAIPAVGLALLYFLPLSEGLEVCIIAFLSMPLGLSPVVIPSGYGMDTSKASALALISHLLSAVTISVVFMVFRAIC